MALFAFVLLAFAAPLSASDGPEDPSSWDSDLQSSLDSISDAPAQQEPSADASALPQESSDETQTAADAPVIQTQARYAVPATLPDPADADKSKTAVQTMQVPSKESINQRKQADLRARVERLEDRIEQNERDVHSLSERLDSLRRSFDEFRRRR